MVLSATQSKDSIKRLYLKTEWMDGWMDLDRNSGIIILDNVP